MESLWKELFIDWSIFPSDDFIMATVNLSGSWLEEYK